MPAHQDNNLRRAWQQEELGVYLLRGFAAVAHVEASQDVGIDAIATLLRPDTARRLTAEHSFYVQLKAGSVLSICYKGDEVNWLRGLQLPFFIGSVDPGQSRLSLYTAHRAMLEVWRSPPPPHIEMRLGERPPQPPESPRSFTDIWLGSPVLQWTPAEIAKPEFLAHAYSVLKPLLEAEETNIRLRKTGFSYIPTWTTGSPAFARDWGLKCALHPQEGLANIVPELAKAVAALAVHCCSHGTREEWRQI